MDALGSLLNGPRAQHPMILRVAMTQPWHVRIADAAPLTIVVVTRGAPTVDHDLGITRTLAVGDVALFRGTHPYSFSDGTCTTPTALIDAGGDCYDPTGNHSVAETMSQGIRTWGNTAADDSTTVLLVGAYQAGEVSRPVLDALQPMTVVPMSGEPILDLLAAEIDRDAPGQDAVLNRLLDVILVSVLRHAMSDDPAGTWFRAAADPAVGTALRLLHNNIDRDWTVAELASAAGVSRAVLARRFTDLVGQPPMKYLAGWRTSVAADLLAGSDQTLNSIARHVGYGTPFALSAAFKRERGISPSEYRRTFAAR